MARKKALTVDPSMADNNVSKLRSNASDHYKECHVLPLIDKLSRFAEDHPEAKLINEFYHVNHIPRSTYYDLLAKWPAMKEAHENTLEKLGSRLFSRAVEFKANWNPVKFMLHAYSPDFAQAKEFDAMLAAKAREATETSNGPQIVVIDRFPDSPIVKGKNHEKDK